MRYSILIVLIILFVSNGVAQNASLTLEMCYAHAEQNFPMVKQRELIARSKEYSMENISKGNLPQVTIAGQATYQSDVTQIPISLPGVDIPTLSKGQYRLYGEVTQPITDLVTVKRQKEAQEVSATIQEQNLEVELYKLKDRVNQIYFGTLLIDEQLKQNDLLKKDIQTAMDRISAAIRFGTELKSNLDKLKAEMLKADQHTIELRASRQAYLDMLGMFINQALNENTILEKPVSIVTNETISRPELKLYDFQKQSYDVQNKLISTRNLPKFALFFQGGFGKPSPVNMLSNEVTPYYLGGIRLNWTLSSFYTSSRERQLLVINQNTIDVQRETFLFNTNLVLKQQRSDISRLQELVRTDDEIIALRASVKQAAQAQVENGVITVNDLLKEINAEDQARLGKVVHETQLLLAQHTYQTTAGQ